MKRPGHHSKFQSAVGGLVASLAALALVGLPVMAACTARREAPAPPKAVLQTLQGDWPLWGGTPSRNMVNDVERGICGPWDPSPAKSVRWTASLGSQTYGNPVVAEGKVLVGTNNQEPKNPKIPGDKGILLCLEESDGKLLWQAAHDKLELGRDHDWPEIGISSTPAVESGRVYYVSNRGELVCADLSGFLDGENDGPFKEERHTDMVDADFLWLLDMVRELGVIPHNASASSPLVVRDLVYVVTGNGIDKDHRKVTAPQAPSFIAVEKTTGRVVWKSNAPGSSIIDGQWSSPSFIDAGGGEQVVFAGGDGRVRSFEPRSGSLLWEFDCRSHLARGAAGPAGGKEAADEGEGAEEDRSQLVATPVCVDGKVYIAMGQDPEDGQGPGCLFAIDAAKRGDITESGLVWKYQAKDFHRSISTVAVRDGLVYIPDLSGYLHCLEQSTGKVCWVDDLLAAVWASPAWIDGRVFIGDGDGDVSIYKAGRALEKLGEIPMESSVYSTIVASHGVLYVTARNKLLAIVGASPPASTPAPGSPAAGSSTRGAPVGPAAPAGPGPGGGTSAGSITRQGWTSFRGSPGMTGFVDSSASGAPKLIWSADLKTEVESTAALADGKAIIGTGESGLVALDLSTGKEVWRLKIDAGIRSSPLVLGDEVLFGDDMGDFRSADLKSGALRWTLSTEGGSEIISSANASGDRVLFGSYDASLYCAAAGSGKLVWRYTTEAPVHASPAVSDAVTFVAGCDGRLRVVDLATGKENGSLDLSDRAASSPVLAGSRLYVGTLGGQVLCVDWKSTKVLWSYRGPEAHTEFYSSAALRGPGDDERSVLVIGGRDKRIHAIRAMDGRGLWTFETGSGVDASPVIVGSRVVAATLDGNLYLLDVDTGKEIWRFSAGAGFAASPSIAWGKMVISNREGVVHCFEFGP